MIHLSEYLNLEDRRIIDSIDDVTFQVNGAVTENGDLAIRSDDAVPLINGAWRETLVGPYAAMARAIDAQYYAAVVNSTEEGRLTRERRRLYGLAREDPVMASTLRDALRAATSKLELAIRAKLNLIYNVSTISIMNTDPVNDLNSARRQAVDYIREQVDAYYQRERLSCNHL